jgi:hypothetical protein
MNWNLRPEKCFDGCLDSCIGCPQNCILTDIRLIILFLVLTGLAYVLYSIARSIEDKWQKNYQKKK